MKRFLKIIGYTLLGIIGLVVVALVVLQFISDEQYKKWIVGAAESATGRELAVDGEFDVGLGMNVSLLARDVRFANAEWGSRENMVTADRLFVRVPLLPLLKGVLDVTLEVDTPDILLETDAEGNGNWVFGQPSAEAEEKPEGSAEEGDGKGAGLPIRPYIRNLEVNNLVFAFNDQSAGTNIDAGVEQLRIFVDGERIPLMLKAQYQGAPITLDGSLGNIDQWFENEQTAVSLQGLLNEAQLAIDGTAGPMLPEPQANLDISVTADSIDTFSDFAGTPLPDLKDLGVTLTLVAGDGRLSTEHVNIALRDSRLMVDVAGSVVDLTDTGIIDMKAAINSASANELLSGLGQQIPYTLPQTVTLNGAIQGDLSALSIRDLELIIKDEGLDVALVGGLENLQALEKGDVDLQIRLDSTALIGQYIGQEIPSFGPLSGTARLISSGKHVKLETLNLNLDDPLISAEISGAVSDIGPDRDNNLAINGIAASGDIRSENLKEIAEKLGLALPGELPQTVTLNGAIQGDLSALSIRDLELIIKDEGLDVTLVGGLENLQAPEGGDVDLQIRLDSTALIGQYIGQEIPSFGPLSGTASLISSGEQVQLETLNLNLDDPLISAKISGSASEIGRDGDNNFAINGIVASGDVRSENLKAIAEKFGALLPVALPASFTLHAAAEGNFNELSLTEMNALLADEGVDVHLVGKIENLIGLKGIEANLTGKAANTSQLSKFAGMELPNLGSLDVQGQIVSTEDGYRLNNLDLHLAGEQADLQVKAAIEDLLKLTKIDAVIDGNLTSLAALSDLTQSELPQTGPWEAHITANSDNLWESPLTLSAKLDGEGIAAALDAQVPNVKEPQTFETDLEVDVSSVAQMLALIDRKVPEDKPLKLTASASGKPGEYHVDEFSVKTEEADLVGDFTYIAAPAAGVERNSLTGNLAINNFDLTPLLDAKEKEAAAMEEAEASSEAAPDSEKAADAEDGKSQEKAPEADGEPKKLFSDEPLTVGALHDYDIDLQIDAANVKIHKEVTLNGNTTVKLDDGYLSIDPFELTQNQGGVGKGYIHLDTRAENGVLDVAMDFDEFVSPRFGGLLNVDMDLDSTGTSVASLMGNLNGHFAASLRDVELLRSFMSQFGAGLLRHLNPLDSDKTLLECAVVRFDIEDGIANFDKQIAAQTLEVTWIGGGEVNLKTEEIDVGISPKARGALSSLTNINLASLVHIGGTLAEPKIGLDVADVAKKYVGYTAFVATGGLSFLAQKLVETTQANVDQCERILQDLEEK